MREQKKKARESLLARIKELIDQVLFNPAVSCQEIRREQFRESRLVVKGGNHRFFGYRGDYAFFYRGCGRDAQRMAVKAPLTEELAPFQNSDHRLLTLFGSDSQLDASVLNVKNSIRYVSLFEDALIFLKSQDRFANPNLAVAAREVSRFANSLRARPGCELATEFQ